MTKKSIGDITVGEILELYKHDTDLLKHILTAKAEEDKVCVCVCVYTSNIN